MLDRDGDGTITKNDLQEMLGRDFSPDDIDQMIKDSGASGEPPALNLLTPTLTPTPTPTLTPTPTRRAARAELLAVQAHDAQEGRRPPAEDEGRRQGARPRRGRRGVNGALPGRGGGVKRRRRGAAARGGAPGFDLVHLWGRWGAGGRMGGGGGQTVHSSIVICDSHTRSDL